MRSAAERRSQSDSWLNHTKSLTTDRKPWKKTVTPSLKAFMPVAPKFPFHKVTCTNCDWSHISEQRSDVLMAPRICGKCGGTKLDHSVPTAIEVLSNKHQEFFKHLIWGRPGYPCSPSLQRVENMHKLWMEWKESDRYTKYWLICKCRKSIWNSSEIMKLILTQISNRWF